MHVYGETMTVEKKYVHVHENTQEKYRISFCFRLICLGFFVLFVIRVPDLKVQMIFYVFRKLNEEEHIFLLVTQPIVLAVGTHIPLTQSTSMEMESLCLIKLYKMFQFHGATTKII